MKLTNGQYKLIMSMSVTIKPWKLESVALLEFKTLDDQTKALRHLSYFSEDLKGKGKSLSCIQFKAISYVCPYSGHNFSKSVLLQFLSSCQQDSSSCCEYDINKKQKLLPYLSGLKYNYYISTVESATSTLDHESYHALYAIDREYRQLCEKIWNRSDAQFKHHVESVLRSLSYHPDVWIDEFQAFTCTEPTYWGSKYYSYARSISHKMIIYFKSKPSYSY
jgi:hypothetical protein